MPEGVEINGKIRSPSLRRLAFSIDKIHGHDHPPILGCVLSFVLTHSTQAILTDCVLSVNLRLKENFWLSIGKTWNDECVLNITDPGASLRPRSAPSKTSSGLLQSKPFGFPKKFLVFRAA